MIDEETLLRVLIRGSLPSLVSAGAETALRTSGDGEAIIDPLAMFRSVIGGVTPDRLGYALRLAGLDLDDTATETAWLDFCDDAATYRRPAPVERLLSEARLSVTVALVAACGGRVAPFDVDPGLVDRLPLLALAADLAPRLPGGTLTIRADHLGSSETFRLHGLASRSALGSVILLDPDVTDESLSACWAHEISHLLDDDLDRVPPPGQEAFANDLGPRLLDASPTTVAACGDLIAAAADATRWARTTAPTSLGELLRRVCPATAYDRTTPLTLAARTSPVRARQGRN